MTYRRTKRELYRAMRWGQKRLALLETKVELSVDEVPRGLGAFCVQEDETGKVCGASQWLSGGNRVQMIVLRDVCAEKQIDPVEVVMHELGHIAGCATEPLADKFASVLFELWGLNHRS